MTHALWRPIVSTFAAVLTDVFDRGAEARLSVEAEAEALAAAKNGEEGGTVALVYAYAPALRKLAARNALTLGVDEARSVAVAGLIEAVHAYDPARGERLAGILPGLLGDHMAERLATEHVVSVPARTLKRFFGILRRADGDVNAAAELAPSYEMTRETFLAVLDAVRGESLDAITATRTEHSGPGSAADAEVEAHSPWGGPDAYADAEDRVLCEVAFRAVDAQEKEVVGLAYGFLDYDPVPDAEIGERLGFSRAKAQRTRSGALGKMREALAVS
jgi:DNA-directed RNA polymerase specialized sigma subunit